MSALSMCSRDAGITPAFLFAAVTVGADERPAEAIAKNLAQALVCGKGAGVETRVTSGTGPFGVQTLLRHPA
jgi:hypothetical protein